MPLLIKIILQKQIIHDINGKVFMLRALKGRRYRPCHLASIVEDETYPFHITATYLKIGHWNGLLTDT